MLPTYLNTLQVSVYKNIVNSTPPPTTLYLNCIPISTSTPEAYPVLPLLAHHSPFLSSHPSITHIYYTIHCQQLLLVGCLASRRGNPVRNYTLNTASHCTSTCTTVRLYKRSFTHFCMHLHGTRPTHNEVLIAFTRGVNTSIPSNYCLML